MLVIMSDILSYWNFYQISHYIQSIINFSGPLSDIIERSAFIELESS